MGADIHLFIEQKSDNKWHRIHPLDVENRLSERNYRVFAVLGNVRNGYGFAGTPTGSIINPISNGRGIPKDSDKSAVDTCLSFEHSASHVYLNELASYSFDEVTRKYGVISKQTFITWDKVSAPNDYCDGVFGKGIKVVTQEEATNILQNELDEQFTDVKVEWEETIADGCFSLIYARDMLLTYCGQNNIPITDIRLVFDFDS